VRSLITSDTFPVPLDRFPDIWSREFQAKGRQSCLIWRTAFATIGQTGQLSL